MTKSTASVAVTLIKRDTLLDHLASLIQLQHGRVVAVTRIDQCPLCDDPAVPKGTVGYVEDGDEDSVLVDFGEPYGVVLCSPNEVR